MFYINVTHASGDLSRAALLGVSSHASTLLPPLAPLSLTASLFADGPFRGGLTPAGWQARVEIRGAVGGLLTRRFFLEGLRGYLDEISDRDL